MKRVIFVATWLAFGGCAAPRHVTLTPYQRAQYECEHAMYAPTTGPLAQIVLYHHCMMLHGWSK